MQFINIKFVRSVNPRTTEGGGYHTRCVFQTPYFSVQLFHKRFRKPLGYSLPHLLVNKFQK